MSVTLDEVRSALEAEEPDYDTLAARFGPEAFGHLAVLARLPDPEIGPKAIYLAALIQGPQGVKILQEAILNQDPLWRIAAAGAAADLGAVDSVPILGQLIGDQDPHVRKEAIASTPLQPGAQLEAALTRMVTLDSEPWVRDEAKTALERINKARL